MRGYKKLPCFYVSIFTASKNKLMVLTPICRKVKVANKVPLLSIYLAM